MVRTTNKRTALLENNRYFHPKRAAVLYRMESSLHEIPSKIRSTYVRRYDGLEVRGSAAQYFLPVVKFSLADALPGSFFVRLYT